MSYRVLVVPEDFTKDEHVLQPVIEKVLADAGKPNAIIRVCRNPNFGGIGEAMKRDRPRKDVIARYPMVDLFILLIDRDGDGGRDKTAAALEAELSVELIDRNARFVAQLAYQEVEVFVLAGHQLPGQASWGEIRADADVKNTYFQALVKEKGVGNYPHDGRKKLMAEGIKNWARIKTRCPEDIGRLIEKLTS